MKKSTLLPPCLLLALTFLAFLPCLNFGFLFWDDYKNVVTNPLIRSLDWTSLRWMATTHYQGPYQPLSWLSLALDFKLWGLRPAGYHLTNLLFHMANAALVYSILRALFKVNENRWAAAAGALFFSIHPLRVESVAWITERRDVLSGFFFLLALAAYQRRALRVSWGAFLAALYAKATTVGLVWVLVALDMTVLQRLPRDPRRWCDTPYREVWKEKIPYLLAAILAGVINLLGFHAQGILQTRYGTADRLLLFLSNGSFYLQKIIWPHPLLPYYELPAHLTGIIVPLTVYALSTVALTGIFWSMRRRFPGLLMAWLSYLLILIPMSGVAQNGQQMAADRYTYLAALPWAALVTGLILWRPRASVLVFPVLGVFLILTRQQVALWRNDETLWIQTLRYAPQCYLAHSNLGTLYLRQGRDAEAAGQLRQAVALRPTDVEARLNLGDLETRQNRFLNAESFYAEALRLEPGNLQVLNNLALVHAREGHFAQAIQELRRITVAAPAFAEAQLNLGILLSHEGFSAEARTCIKRAVTLKPELAKRFSRSRR